MTLAYTTVILNSAEAGGAAYLDPASTLDIFSSYIARNSAKYVGGIHALPPAALSRRENDNSTIESDPLYYGITLFVWERR